MAHSNLVQSGDAFAFIQSTATGYFSAKEALRIFERDLTIDGKRYYLPSKEEFEGIFPDRTIGLINRKADQNGNYTDLTNEVVVGGKHFFCTLDMTAVPNSSRSKYYVLFKGGDGRNLVAMRQQAFGSWQAGSTDSFIVVTSRYIGVKGLAGRSQRDLIKVISHDNFWRSNNEHDVSVTFHCTGLNEDNKVQYRGQYVSYLTRTRIPLVDGTPNGTPSIATAGINGYLKDGNLQLNSHAIASTTIDPYPRNPRNYKQIPIRPFRRF